MTIIGVNAKLSDQSGPWEDNFKGLKDVNMNNLPRIIGITGKNGAGKSRFLSLISFLIETRNRDRSTHVSNYNMGLEKIDYSRKYGASEYDLIRQESEVIGTYREKINKYIHSSQDNEIRFETINYNKEIRRNQGIGFEDCNANIDIKNVDEFFAYVHGVFKAKIKAKIDDFNWSKDDKSKIEFKYNKLVELFKEHFQLNLMKDNNLNPIIDGVPIDGFCSVCFSPGQKIILQALIISDLLDNDSDSSVIFWDEPEKNLHPDAMFSLIERILSKRPNSQLWIATHSIALLSYLDSHPEGEVWFMDQGKIKKSGRIPETVLSTLMGDNNKCEALQNFVNSPSRYALLRYATECLVPPESVDTPSTDPQLKQIRSIIQGMGQKISVLDYGAGKGRLMKILDPLDDRNIDIEYYAYDKYDNDKDHILKSMKSRGINTKNYIYEESFLDKRNFGNLCIMSNVLHEISPDDWGDIFAVDGIIGKFLSKDGYLLIVEDYHLPTGETAHNYGFILPDADQLKILFRINSESPSDFVTSDANHAVGYSIEGRLKAHLIHRKFLDNVNDSTIRKCIEAVKDDALKNIMKTRKHKEQKDYKKGIRHAFWTMQFANCSLFLEPFKEENKT